MTRVSRARALQEAHDALAETWSLLADLDMRRRECERLLRGEGASVVHPSRFQLFGPIGGDARWEVEIAEDQLDLLRANATAAGLNPDPEARWVRTSRWPKRDGGVIVRERFSLGGGPLPRLWRSCGCIACTWPKTLGRNGTCDCAALGCWCVIDGHQRKD